MAAAAAASRNKRGGGGSNKELEVRRGPWTLEEDTLLIHYIACHGEGRWNLLARCSGLKRTGKSCRLRWLNYLKPDIKRGNLSPEEQLLILDLHSKWGNRWSRIAQYLPGRTDNEIKNYWRTRVQKQARQLKIDANSAMFRDALRCYWMPRLLEKYAAAASPPQSMQTLANLDRSNHSAAAPAMIDDRHNQSQQPLLQDLHFRPSLQCQLGDEIRAGSVGFNSNSAATALPSQLPDLPQFSMDGIPGGIELNPLHASDCNPIADSTARHLASDYDLIADPNCSSNKNINGGSLWSTDELYGMLKSYMEIGEDAMFRLDGDDVSV